MLFSEYPVANIKCDDNKLSFDARGDESLSFRMAIVPLDGEELKATKVKIVSGDEDENVDPDNGADDEHVEYTLHGNSQVEVTW